MSGDVTLVDFVIENSVGSSRKRPDGYGITAKELLESRPEMYANEKRAKAALDGLVDSGLMTKDTMCYRGHVVTVYAKT